MRAVIITKPTNLEQHGAAVRAQVSRAQLSENYLNRLQTAHDEHYQCLETTRKALEKHGIDYEEVTRGELWSDLSLVDMVISVGGDGTLLAASHRILTPTPVIGIRSSASSVGYLCAGGADEIDTILKEFKDGSLLIGSCARLKASIYYAEENQHRQTVPVLNDFLFTNSNPSATSRYALTWNDIREVHKSSGIWIATATGSTAAIRAAGGTIMDRLDPRSQFKVRELYQVEGSEKHILEGIFDPEICPITIENQCDSALLALDGQRGVISLKFGDRVSFQKGPNIQIALPLNPPKLPSF